MISYKASDARPERRSFENKNRQFTSQIACHAFTVSTTGLSSTLHEKSCMLNLGLISLLFLVIVNTVIADSQTLASNELRVFASVTLVSPCSQVRVRARNEPERVGFSLATRE